MYGEKYEETPKQKEKIRLLTALNQVDNITELTKNNEWKTYIYSHLSTVKYELERQLSNLSDSKEI
tara:strand:- start:72 stop:269 length:198 start_codon:yes stop_codon:yes gene_type:complete